MRGGRATLALALALACSGAWTAGRPAAAAGAALAAADAADGRELIAASLRRHALPPHVFEEQTFVLSDPLGQHTVRTVRRYVRTDEQGSIQLLVVDTPAETRGVRVFVARNGDGSGRRGADPASALFGSNFTVADLEGEQLQDFRYAREADEDLGRVPHYVLVADPKAEAVAAVTGYGRRRIHLRKDNLFVTRIDYLDHQGRPARRQSFRAPRPDESGAWRPGMVLMEDLREQRRTLLKIERRVHSRDYVPASIFAGLPEATERR